MKSNKALYWVISVVAVAMVIFVYIMLGEAPRTLPKITLSYFVDEKEIATSVSKRLFQEIGTHKNYWIGVEPDQPDHLKIAAFLKNELEKNSTFKEIIIDEELALSKETMALFQATDTIPVKHEIFKLGELLQTYEKQGTSYLVITASIYASSLLKKNPIDVLREKYQITPMTFALGYLPVSAADEKNMQFACNTEDRAGTSDWGCVVVNKSRSVRRKMNLANAKPWVGLMDLTGENDYMILAKKK